MNNFVTLDLETIPSGKYPTTEYMIENHPKTMKVEKTIKAWAEKEENKEEAFRKRAVNPMQAQVIVISAAFKEEKPIIIAYDDEEKVFKEFDRWLSSIETNTPVYAWDVVGQNIEFDLDMLFIRASKYDCFKIKDLVPDSPYSDRIQDTMKLPFPASRQKHYVSLDVLLKYFNIGE
ncbi:unnamed protein product, partial [marine sediment metagenome]